MSNSRDPNDFDEPSSSGGTTIQSVVVANMVLEALASVGGAMGVTELANRLGLPKARVHRHLTTLRQLGLVDQDRASERYGLGWKLFHLGQAAAEQFEIRRLAEPAMHRLRNETQQTVVLSVPAGREALVVAAIESTNMVTISVRQGMRLPAHASAQGRIVLAFSSPDVQEEVLGEDLPSLTPTTLVDKGALRSRLARIREQLYETAVGETLFGISTLAAPLLDHENALVGVIAVVGSQQHIPEGVDPKQLRAVQAAAAEVSQLLNSHAYDRIQSRL